MKLAFIGVSFFYYNTKFYSDLNLNYLMLFKNMIEKIVLFKLFGGFLGA
ncbi:hypothetical protein baBA2_000566 [Borrelia anserina]|uniref:Uncharacterized protein n=1 Tax=Borrelia anserina BA2 TaxID=1313293 RepID=W5SMZ4_BORAN|nr:hypothetical protein [Borrelia anserina]AHH08549.1 hypothetical protein BAN_0900010 [Borrelia anserina BA2]UPA06941.1 hypothetical protein baBA2_000566 [Borrelia anserina]